jgi:hypothetical protein
VKGPRGWVHAKRVVRGFAAHATWVQSNREFSDTRDSNQHRSTASQALRTALGQGFTSLSDIICDLSQSTPMARPRHEASGEEKIGA